MALNAILDTRFLFSYFNPENKEVGKWTKKVVELSRRGVLSLGISTITITELYRTMGRVIGVEVVEIRVKSMENAKIVFIPVTREISEKAGLISLNRKIPIADAVIAATAIKYAKGVVLTDDEHFNLIKEVKPKWLSF